MKKINSLRLNNLTKVELEKRELNKLTGGICNNACGCFYAGTGGSSTYQNGMANYYIYSHQ